MKDSEEDFSDKNSALSRRRQDTIKATIARRHGDLFRLEILEFIVITLPYSKSLSKRLAKSIQKPSLDKSEKGQCMQA